MYVCVFKLFLSSFPCKEVEDPHTNSFNLPFFLQPAPNKRKKEEKEEKKKYFQKSTPIIILSGNLNFKTLLEPPFLVVESFPPKSLSLRQKKKRLDEI